MPVSDLGSRACQSQPLSLSVDAELSGGWSLGAMGLRWAPRDRAVRRHAAQVELMAVPPAVPTR